MKTETRKFDDDGTIPNNPALPLLVYRGALEPCDAEAVQQRFRDHQWSDTWVNGVFDWHHYHSTAHEVLGCIGGSAKVQFGGESGEAFTIEAGDVVVIPAGVGHCNLGATDDFRVVGGYPEGQSADMNRESADEAIRRNIREVPSPKQDPVIGGHGELLRVWGKQ